VAESGTLSHEVIELFDVILADIHKVKRVVAPLIIVHGPDQPLELVHIERLWTEHVVVQGVQRLLFQKVEDLVAVEVNVVGAKVLEESLIGEGGVVRHVLPVVPGPFLLLNRDLVPVVVEKGAHVEAEESDRDEAGHVWSLSVHF
jgi:hypothetical protein